MLSPLKFGNHPIWAKSIFYQEPTIIIMRLFRPIMYAYSILYDLYVIGDCFHPYPLS